MYGMSVSSEITKIYFPHAKISPSVLKGMKMHLRCLVRQAIIFGAHEGSISEPLDLICTCEFVPENPNELIAALSLG
jgi:hypothetical protein